jgi:hypothetical protein
MYTVVHITDMGLSVFNDAFTVTQVMLRRIKW